MRPGGRALETTKFLSPTLPFFADHFPGQPLMPGVLLIECAAQASGVLWAESRPDLFRPVFHLVQVLNFKLLKKVLPGQTIQTQVLIEREFGSLGQFSCIIKKEGVPVASGRIVLSHQARLIEESTNRRKQAVSSLPRAVRGKDFS